MKRLCIFVTYDDENIADEYIRYILIGLRETADCLAVVCNYEHVLDGIENIRPYADKIYYRQNIGFDAGAYKDALCTYMGWDEVCKYDELLLVNDSFYGPIYPFENIFGKMEKVDTDFWGMTRSPAGILNNAYKYDSHIQSYFIVFRKRILLDNGFRKFWEEMVYPESLLQAILSFELECNKYLKNQGFKGTALTDLCELKYHVKENDNPYLLFPFEMIRDADIPIIKRKSLNLRNRGFKNALEALKYIREQNLYNVDFINKHLLRIGKSTQVWKGINYSKLDAFYHSHLKVYIYGAGIYGKNLAGYFNYKGWSFEGFLVTGMENQSDECIPFDMADISGDDGIIIAVGNEEVFNGILNTVEKRCNKNQICI